MGLVGARPRAARGDRLLGGYSHYFLGARPITGVPHFGQVRQDGVYPGISLVYHSDKDQIEFDFRVAPGADPRRIRLRYSGASGIRQEKGDLVFAAGGELRQKKPQLYQIIDGKRREVEGGYRVARSDED